MAFDGPRALRDADAGGAGGVSTAADFDVLTIGRVGVDFYPTSTAVIVNVKHFDKFLGGSPTNVAVAAARLGERSRA